MQLDLPETHMRSLVRPTGMYLQRQKTKSRMFEGYDSCRYVRVEQDHLVPSPSLILLLQTDSKASICATSHLHTSGQPRSSVNAQPTCNAMRVNPHPLHCINHIFKRRAASRASQNKKRKSRPWNQSQTTCRMRYLTRFYLPSAQTRICHILTGYLTGWQCCLQTC